MLSMIVTAIPGSTPDSSPETNENTIDSHLMSVMADLESENEIEIIVQFRNEVKDEDVRELERLDIQLIHQYRIIPGVYAKGSVESVMALSNYHRTYWIEHNYKFKLALNETTSVIGATTAWNAEVKDGSYDHFDVNQQSKLAGLDGSGVTVVVVDTGIDGQHPDFDYGEKLLMSLHKNGADDPWVEKRNSDTSYGHGTHCAGIVAGNGDASGGQRRGVAPGANLIGVGGDWVPTGDDVPVHWVVLEGLEWVYEHSRPDNNPHNIRVVSNSWGGEGDYDPMDAITVISNRITYDNNVLVVFAAMNNGTDNHDGEVDTTSQQSKIPSVISVAATTHDGEGMAPFSSRGKKGDHITYPDIAAPGVNIWATRPRGTWLGEYQLEDEDMYYMAISGTSMATPHVAGLAAILFQAAPSLKVSEHHDTYNGGDGSWGNRKDTHIHEIEYLLQMTADMIPSDGSNGVPGDTEKGVSGRKMDFAQGYGLVNTEKAVAVALTLEKMREDHSDATVDDALKEYKKVQGTVERTRDTDRMVTSWRGEWAHLTNGSNPLSDVSFATDQHHSVYIPEEAVLLEFDLNYNFYDTTQTTAGTIDVTLDWDGNGVSDISPQIFDIDGTKHYEVDLTSGSAADHKGKYWTFNVMGQGIKIPLPNPEDEFQEALIEYTVDLTLSLDPAAQVTFDETGFAKDNSPWLFAEPSDSYAGAEVTLKKNVFDVSDVEYQESFFEEYRVMIAGSVIILLIGIVIGFGLMVRYRDGAVGSGPGSITEDGGRGSGTDHGVYTNNDTDTIDGVVTNNDIAPIDGVVTNNDIAPIDSGDTNNDIAPIDSGDTNNDTDTNTDTDVDNSTIKGRGVMYDGPVEWEDPEA